MIHGWSSYHGVWRQTVEAFKESHYCVLVDLLGFGESDKPEGADYSIEAQGQRILSLTDILGLDQFALMGHSMGGQIALCIASMLTPSRVTKLISVGGVVTARLMPRAETVYWLTATGAVFPGLYSLARWLSRYRWYAHLFFRPWFYKMDVIPFKAWQMDRYMALQPGGHAALYKAGQAIHNLNLTAYLAQIVAPTLAIFGQQEGAVYVSDGSLVEQYVPDSRLVLIDQCGHFPMYEQPQRYLAALRDFLL